MGTNWLKVLVALVWMMSVSQVSGQHLDYLSKAPFYKTYKKQAMQNAKMAYLPVAIDKMVVETFFYKDRVEVLRPLIDTMNVYLSSVKMTSVDVEVLPQKGRPYVFVGSSEAETAPPGSEMMREAHHKYAPMVIYLDKPSKAWKAEVVRLLEGQDAEYMMAFWIGFVEFPKANKGVFKKKVVLGTHYEPDIRFLSAEDKPVEVLLVTGILFNKQGEVLRAGAEGIVHEDTPFWAQVLELNKSVDDKTVQSVVSDLRREDLPGKPLAWKAALDMLIHQLHPKANIIG